MKPIHKFNGGNPVTICNDCRTIINSGTTDEIFCSSCYDLRQDIEKAIRTTLIVTNKWELKNCVDKIVEAYDKNKELSDKS